MAYITLLFGSYIVLFTVALPCAYAYRKRHQRSLNDASTAIFCAAIPPISLGYLIMYVRWRCTEDYKTWRAKQKKKALDEREKLYDD